MENMNLTQVNTKQCKCCKKEKTLNNYCFNFDFCNDCISDEDRSAIERLTILKFAKERTVSYSSDVIF